MPRIVYDHTTSENKQRPDAKRTKDIEDIRARRLFKSNALAAKKAEMLAVPQRDFEQNISALMARICAEAKPIYENFYASRKKITEAFVALEAATQGAFEEEIWRLPPPSPNGIKVSAKIQKNRMNALNNYRFALKRAGSACGTEKMHSVPEFRRAAMAEKFKESCENARRRYVEDLSFAERGGIVKKQAATNPLDQTPPGAPSPEATAESAVPGPVGV